jgi:hypothetical protein
VARCQHVDLQHIARPGVLNPHRPGERMNASAVDGQVLFRRHARVHLSAAGVDAFECHFIAWLDA